MYHKIIDEDENIIGFSGPDSDEITDENWIEITEEEYKELEKQTEKNTSDEFE